MYDYEDYGDSSETVAQIYEHLAKLYIQSNDSESALDSLAKYVKYSLSGWDAFHNGFVHTSPLFNRLTVEKNNFVTDHSGTAGDRILHTLNCPIYDSVRETEQFQDIIKKLSL